MLIKPNNKFHYLLYFIAFLGLFTVCIPVESMNRTDCLVRKYLASHYTEKQIKARIMARVERYDEIKTWLFNPPILVYYKEGFDIYPIVAARDDSIYWISKETEFNRLIEKEPFLVENDSVALQLLKEFFKFRFYNPNYQLLYLTSINQLPYTTRAELKSLQTNLPSIIESDKIELNDTLISNEYREFLDEIVSKNAKRLFIIDEILNQDIRSPKVKSVKDGFEIFVTFCNFNEEDIWILYAKYFIRAYGKIEGETLVILQESTNIW